MKIKMYSRIGCPFCEMAKQWFDNNGIAVEEIQINDFAKRTKFYSEMNQSGKVRKTISTVPQIFLEEEHIGGYDDLMDNVSYILEKVGK